MSETLRPWTKEYPMEEETLVNPQTRATDQKWWFDSRIALAGAIVGVISMLGTIGNSIWVNNYTTRLSDVQAENTRINSDLQMVQIAALRQETDINKRADERDYDLKVFERVFNTLRSSSKDELEVAALLIDTVYDPVRKKKLSDLLTPKVQQYDVLKQQLADISKAATLESAIVDGWMYGLDWCVPNKENSFIASEVSRALHGVGATVFEMAHPSNGKLPQPTPVELELRHVAEGKDQVVKLQAFLKKSTGLDFKPKELTGSSLPQQVRPRYVGIWACIKSP